MKKVTLIFSFLLTLQIVSLNLFDQNLLSQTKLNGSFKYLKDINRPLILFEYDHFYFNGDGTFKYKLNSDGPYLTYGCGNYIIENDFLTLKFETIPQDELDTLFVNKQIEVDSITFSDSIHYTFIIRKLDSSFFQKRQ